MFPHIISFLLLTPLNNHLIEVVPVKTTGPPSITNVWPHPPPPPHWASLENGWKFQLRCPKELSIRTVLFLLSSPPSLPGLQKPDSGILLPQRYGSNSPLTYTLSKNSLLVLNLKLVQWTVQTIYIPILTLYPSNYSSHFKLSIKVRPQ